MLLGFSLGCSEFVVIGIESDLATELGVSLATAGQLISVFALVYAIATPVLALSTGRFRRYQLLVCYSVVFVLGNLGSWRWLPTSSAVYLTHCPGSVSVRCSPWA